MTNDIAEVKDDSHLEEEVINPFDQPEGTDWFLAWIINHAEVLGVEQSVTLSVGGTLITGIVTSGRKYFEGIEALMLNAKSVGAADQNIPSILSKSYGQWKELYPDIGSGLELGSQKPKYIHLKNAKTLAGAHFVPNNNGLLWRGKLSSIDGFTLGEMGAD